MSESELEYFFSDREDSYVELQNAISEVFSEID